MEVPAVWSVVGQRVRSLLARPFVRHLIRAFNRFSERLGWQFSAALTYFSFLAVVPIIMVGFSVAGFVLASRPHLIAQLQSSIFSLLPGTLATSISSLLDEAINARLTVGVIGLVFALYSGVSWMGNLRSAIQAVWRPDFDTEQEIAAESLPRYYLKSLLYLVALTLGIVISLGLTTVGTSAQDVVIRWFGLDKVSGLTPLFTIVPILLAMAADMVIFAGVYSVLPPKTYKPTRTPLLRGAAAAAIAFEVLKFGLTYLLPTLLKSATARVFGPIIGLLIFFNLVATVVLFLAAWIATAAGSASAATPAPFSEQPHGARSHRRHVRRRPIRLPVATAEQLDRIAATEGGTREDLVRLAVARYLAERAPD